MIRNITSEQQLSPSLKDDEQPFLGFKPSLNDLPLLLGTEEWPEVVRNEKLTDEIVAALTNHQEQSKLASRDRTKQQRSKDVDDMAFSH